MLGHTKTKIQPMEYRTIVVAGLGQNESSEQVDSPDLGLSVRSADEVEARVRELNEEREQDRKNFEKELVSVRRVAFEAGRKSVEDEHSAARNAVSEQLGEAIEEFRQTRDRYLAQVEREVVRLSLAIAERILHRQAQIDPLLLSGAVRVALGQLSESTDVRLKVPLDEQTMWEDMLRLMPNLPLRPELTVDERMKAGECTIETHLGSIDIGVRAQLAEIERVFFDLLEHRERISGDLQLAD
jgi:flagellar assembly protein FliH